MSFRKRKSEVSFRPKQSRNSSRTGIQDLLPFQVPNIDNVPLQTKQYINELENQYIERYNILLNNRKIYQQIIQSMSTELDEKGINLHQLSNFYKMGGQQKIEQVKNGDDLN